MVTHHLRRKVAQKNFLKKIPLMIHSSNDQRIVGIILSHALTLAQKRAGKSRRRRKFLVYTRATAVSVLPLCGAIGAGGGGGTVTTLGGGIKAFLMDPPPISLI